MKYSTLKHMIVCFSSNGLLDPLDIIGLPASWAAMDKSLCKSVHPLHDSEYLLVISSLEEGGLYVFGTNVNLAARYICPPK
jgi:hypothetical protein